MFDSIAKALQEDAAMDGITDEVVVLEEGSTPIGGDDTSSELVGTSDVSLNDVDDMENEIDSELTEDEIKAIDKIDLDDEKDIEEEDEEDSFMDEVLEETLDDIMFEKAGKTLDEELDDLFEGENSSDDFDHTYNESIDILDEGFSEEGEGVIILEDDDLDLEDDDDEDPEYSDDEDDDDEDDDDEGEDDDECLDEEFEISLDDDEF